MRNWMPAAGVSALAAAGLLLVNQPNPAGAQSATAVPVTQVVETSFLGGSVEFEEKGKEAVKPISVSFPGRLVQSADVMIKGFDARFVDAEHPVHELKVRTENVQISGETVKFDARLALRDNSGNFDDKYSGRIDYVVIARVR